MPFLSVLPALPGREPELLVLASAFARAGAGEGSALTVRGEPGIGKSALLDAVARGAVLNGFAVVRLAGQRADRHVALAGLDGVAGAFRGAARELLAMGTGDRPLVLVLDDLHRFDRPAVHALSGAARAAELAAAARTAARCGDLRSASRATEHAARLATRPKLLERELVRAAELALDGGETLRTRALLDEAERGPYGRADARWVRERLDGAAPPDAAGTRELARAAEREAAAGAPDRALALLVRAAESFEVGDAGPVARAAVRAALERVDAEPDDLRRLAVLALVASEDAPPDLPALLARALTRDAGGVPGAVLAGIVAGRCGDDALAHRCLTTAATGWAAHGVARLRAQALARRAWAGIGLARWDEAAADAQEAGLLAERTRQPLWAARAYAAAALVAGSRGESDRSEDLAGRAERLAVPLNGTSVLADVVWARGRTALADGRHDEALLHLSRLLDPADLAHDRERVSRALPDLADAAVGAGAGEQLAAALVARHPDPTAASAVVAHAIVLANQDLDAALRIAGAIDRSTLTPFEWARLQLVLGALLRRARRGLESRRPLIAAEETFTALGAAPWAARAHGELRASGHAPRRHGPRSRDELTPQERQIARLAATGLSNREIGQRLFLSPRTVSSHLYRVFPKLGVTSRAQLRDALMGEAVAA